MTSDQLTPPIDLSTPLPVRRLIAAAELALALGATAEARAAALQLLFYFPNNLIAQHLLGQLLIEEEQDRLALPHFARILQHNPLDATAWIGLGLSQQARADEEAARLSLLRARELALPADSDDLAAEEAEQQVPLRHALLALRAGQHELAVLILRRIRLASPERHELLVLEAEGLRRLGEEQAARDLLGMLPRAGYATLPALLVRAALLEDNPQAAVLHQQIAEYDLDGRFAAQFFSPRRQPWPLPSAPTLPWPDRPGILPDLVAQLGEHFDTLGGALLAGASAADPEVAQHTTVPKRGPADGASPATRQRADTTLAELAATIEAQRGRLLERSGVRPLQPWPAAQRGVQLMVTSRQALLRKYGESGCDAVLAQLAELAAALRDRAVSAELCLVDDADSLKAYPGLRPVEVEPGAISTLIQGVERRLASQGRAVTIVLLIGGDDIMPFHRLPNASDDSDGPTLSDLPYGGGDSAEVLPRWAVARVPDGEEQSPRLLLHLLEQMISYHRGWQTGLALPQGCLMPQLGRRRRPATPAAARAFGLSTAVWREASEAIYGPLGSDRPLRLSPPEDERSFQTDWLIGRRLLYFNLHGAHGSPNWYGEAEWGSTEGPRLPVILTPDILGGDIATGTIVVSEACYGAEIVGRGPGNAIALRTLAEGALAFVGSTVTAYGAPSAPLAAADLFTARLCQRLAGGEAIGPATHAAREDFIREVYQQHGFMDGDDLKTLQSFVLYGDPWASLAAEPTRPTTPKAALALPFLARELHPLGESQLPRELLASVRQLLGKLLPGGADSMSVALRPLGPGGAKGGAERQALVFNAEQEVPAQDGRTLISAAHLTLVKTRLVKTVVSR